jgi:hypothetical protein
MPHYATGDGRERLWRRHREQRLGRIALASFMESARRTPPLRVHEAVRTNGDASPFAFEKGVLLRGVEWVPAVLVGSEIALHVLEYHGGSSAVCSYNRVMRFDEVDHGDTATIGLCLYMGSTPIAAKLASGEPFLRSELSIHVIEVPRTPALERVTASIREGFARAGVPAAAHGISKFVF